MEPKEDLVELPCPSCGQVTHVFEHVLANAGEFPCSACGEMIQIRPAPKGITGAFPIQGSTLPPPTAPSSRTGSQAHQIRLDEWQETGAAGDDLIRCPACGHRFDPQWQDDLRPVALVVEAAEFFRELASKTLRSRFRVATAASVAEARNVLATQPIDLLLLDLSLPDGDGIEVLKSLPRAGIPVLIYTNKDESQLWGEEWDNLQALGVRDAVRKGINTEETLLRKAAQQVRITP